MPTFSIIMSVFNHEAFVEQAVESVLAQSCTDWELILIDDGSTDRSPELLDHLAHRDARIRPIHKANSGLADSRNLGIAKSLGSWVTYLDSDDLWLPHTLETYARHLERRPQAQFMFGYMHRLRGQKITEVQPPQLPSPPRTRDLYRRMFLMTPAVCHLRELAECAGGFDRQLRYCDDYDFFLRMSLHCDMEPLGVALGLRRRHENNMSQRSGKSQLVEARVLARFAQRAPDIISASLRARRVGQIYARAARCFFREGDYNQALECGLRAQSCAPTLRGRMLCCMCRWLGATTNRVRPLSDELAAQ